MTKKEEIKLVVKCATNCVLDKRSCSGCDEQFLCRKIQNLLRQRLSRFKNPSL